MRHLQSEHPLAFPDDPGASRLLARGKRKALLKAAAEAHEDLIDMNQFGRRAPVRGSFHVSDLHTGLTILSRQLLFNA